jgi:NAD(P)-dependent dehydrogenase (short-subunit alcohol dehydrogenase family)
MANKKTVIVTGSSRGIGAAIVRAFLDRGYNVVATHYCR